MISTTPNHRRRFAPWMEESCHYFVASQWRVPGAPEQVADSFLRLDELSQWWPQFLNVETLNEGDRFANGRRVRVVTKGFLPYRLRFEFRLTTVDYPSYFCLEAHGDFHGCGRGWISSAGDDAVINFQWQIEVRKPLLRRWSWLLRPLFISNHRWVMAQGQSGLRRSFSNRNLPPALAS